MSWTTEIVGPDGMRYPFISEEEPTEEDRKKLLDSFEKVSRGSDQGWLESHANAGARGFLESGASLVEGIGDVTGIDPISDTGKEIKKDIRNTFPVDPIREDDFSTKAAGAVGQGAEQLLELAIPFSKAAAAGKAMKAAEGAEQIASATAKYNAAQKVAKTVGYGSAFMKEADSGEDAAAEYGLDNDEDWLRQKAMIFGYAALGTGAEMIGGLGVEKSLGSLLGGEALSDVGVRALLKGGVGEYLEEAPTQIGQNTLLRSLVTEEEAAALGIRRPGFVEGANEAGMLGGIAGMAMSSPRLFMTRQAEEAEAVAEATTTHTDEAVGQTAGVVAGADALSGKPGPMTGKVDADAPVVAAEAAAAAAKEAEDTTGQQVMPGAMAGEGELASELEEKGLVETSLPPDTIPAETPTDGQPPAILEQPAATVPVSGVPVVPEAETGAAGPVVTSEEVPVGVPGETVTEPAQIPVAAERIPVVEGQIPVAEEQIPVAQAEKPADEPYVPPPVPELPWTEKLPVPSKGPRTFTGQTLGDIIRGGDVVTFADGSKGTATQSVGGVVTIENDKHGKFTIGPHQQVGVIEEPIRPGKDDKVSFDVLRQGEKVSPEVAEKMGKEVAAGMKRIGLKTPVDVVLLNENDPIPSDQESTMGTNKGLFYPGVNGGNHTVYLNRDRLTNDTPVHELFHGYLPELRRQRPDVYRQGVELLESNQDYLRAIRELYPEYEGEALYDEALNSLLGIEGRALWEKTAKSGALSNKLRQFIARVKLWLDSKLRPMGITGNMTLEQWAKARNTEVFAGKPVFSETKPGKAAPKASVDAGAVNDPSSAKTQIPGTVSTYRKAAGILPKGIKNLDYGAGMGLGADALKAGGVKTDTYEPFPTRWRGDSPVTFEDSKDIKSGSYGSVTNFSVLNVVKPPVRDSIVREIGRILAPGGTALITARTLSNVGVAKNKTPSTEPGGFMVGDRYQKGFTQKELGDYVAKILGPQFTVAPNPELNGASIKVTKGAAPKASVDPDAQGFYSQAARVIEAKMPKKASAEQVKAILTNPANGVKTDELKWSGILPVLGALKGPVTKDEILAYLTNDGDVKFEEVTSAKEKGASVVKSAEDAVEHQHGWIIPGGTILDVGDTPQEAADRWNDANRPTDLEEGRAPKWGDWQVSGGKNYQETVLTIPSEGGSKYTADRHFPGIPNYVAHLRTNEREDASGEPGLFIEEIQSDRHQEGRKEGYTEDIEAAKAKALEVTRKYVSPTMTMPVSADVLEGMGATKEELAFVRKAEESGSFAARNTVPDAPYRNSWPLQMFKRALRNAVAGGKTWVGWTDGKTQNDRYSLSTQIEGIEWKTSNGRKSVVLEQKGNGSPVSLLVDGTGTVAAVGSSQPAAEGLKGKTLDEVIGKDMAGKVMSEDSGDLSGIELDLGGSGMKGFYDKMLPTEVGKYVKQWGAKVEKSDLKRPASPEFLKAVAAHEQAVAQHGVTSQEAEDAFRAIPNDSKHDAGTPIWKVRITPAMAESVKKGQPKYSRDPGVRDAEYVAAVKSGDVVKQQQIINQVAEDNGWDPANPFTHGTTHMFNVFRNDKANVENDLGKGFYFTNTPDDAEANYAGEGPDLTGRINSLADDIYQNDDEGDEDGEEMTYEKAKEKAREILSGGNPRSLEVFIKFDNPVVLGGPNPTTFSYSESYDEETEEYGEPEGSLIKILNAVDQVSFDEFDNAEAKQQLMTEARDNEGLTASEVETILRREAQYAMDANGNMASGEVVRAVFEEAGFDGIEDHTVNQKFGTRRRYGSPMEGVYDETVHRIAFHSAQIKSAAPAEYDDEGNLILPSQRFTTSPDIRYSRNPGESPAKMKPSGLAINYRNRPGAPPSVRESFEHAEYLGEKGPDAVAEADRIFASGQEGDWGITDHIEHLQKIADRKVKVQYNMTWGAYWGRIMQQLGATYNKPGASPETKGQALDRMRELNQMAAGIVASRGQFVKGIDHGLRTAFPELQIEAMERETMWNTEDERQRYDANLAEVMKIASEIHKEAIQARIKDAEAFTQDLQRALAPLFKADDSADAGDAVAEGESNVREHEVAAAKNATFDWYPGAVQSLQKKLQDASIEYMRAMWSRYLKLQEKARRAGNKGPSASVDPAMSAFMDMVQSGAVDPGPLSDAELDAGIAEDERKIAAALAKFDTLTEKAKKPRKTKPKTPATEAAPETGAEEEAEEFDISTDEGKEAYVAAETVKTLLRMVEGKKPPGKKTADQQVVNAIIKGLTQQSGVHMPIDPEAANNHLLAVGLLLHNQDIASGALERAQNIMRDNPDTAHLITDGALQSWGQLAIGKQMADDPTDGGLYDYKMVAKAARNELKTAQADMRKLIKDAALANQTAETLEKQLRDPNRGLEAKMGKATLDKVVNAVIRNYRKNLADRAAAQQKSEAEAAARRAAKAEEANSPEARRERLINQVGREYAAERVRLEREIGEHLDAARKAQEAGNAAEAAKQLKKAEDARKQIDAQPGRLSTRFDLTEEEADDVIEGTEWSEDRKTRFHLQQDHADARARLAKERAEEEKVLREFNARVKKDVATYARQNANSELKIEAWEENITPISTPAEKARWEGLIAQERGFIANNTKFLAMKFGLSPEQAAEFMKGGEWHPDRKNNLQSRRMAAQVRKETAKANAADVRRNAVRKVTKEPEKVIEWLIRKRGLDLKGLKYIFDETLREKGVEAAVNKVATELHLDEDQGKQFIRPVVAKAMEHLTQKRKDEVEHALRDRTEEIANRKPKPTELQKLTKLINLGALDHAAFADVLLGEAGKKKFTDSFKARLREHLRRANDLSIPRVSSSQSRALFAREIEAARGASATKLVGEGFMANLFGGIGTQKVNLLFGWAKVMMDTWAYTHAVTSVAGLKGAEGRMARRAMWQAFARGYAGDAQGESKYLLKTGFSVGEDPALHFTNSTLENIRAYPDMELRWTKNGAVAPESFRKIAYKLYKYHAYVRRAMVASDLWNRTPVYELMKAAQSVKAIAGDPSKSRPKSSAEYLERMDVLNYGEGGLKGAMAESKAKAAAAVKAGTITEVQSGAYVRELLDEKMAKANGMSGPVRQASVREDAKRFTLSADSEGLFGQLTTTMTQASTKYPFFGAFVPAIRTPINFAYQTLDWSPYGFIREQVARRSGGAYSSLSTHFWDNDQTRGWPRPAALITKERQIDMRVKAITGSSMLAILGVALAASIDDDDDKAWFFIAGKGPKDATKARDFKARGLTPYTVRLGGIDFNYRETPLYAVMVPLGALSDAIRYGDPGDSDSERFGAAFAASIQSFADQAVLKSMQDALAIISGGSTQQGDPGQLLARVSARTLSTVIAPNLGRDLNQILYGPGNTKEQAWAGNVLENFPFAPALFRQPAINALGDEIHEKRGGALGELPTTIGYRIATKPVNDPQLHLVAHLGLNKLSTTRLTKDGREVMDQYDVVRQWAKVSGKAIREYLTPAKMAELEALRKTDPKKAEKDFDKAVKDIRTRELDKLLK